MLRSEERKELRPKPGTNGFPTLPSFGTTSTCLLLILPIRLFFFIKMHGCSLGPNQIASPATAPVTQLLFCLIIHSLPFVSQMTSSSFHLPGKLGSSLPPARHTSGVTHLPTGKKDRWVPCIRMRPVFQCSASSRAPWGHRSRPPVETSGWVNLPLTLPCFSLRTTLLTSTPQST